MVQTGDQDLQSVRGLKSFHVASQNSRIRDFLNTMNIIFMQRTDGETSEL